MKSFIDVPVHHPFPLQNLPYGVFLVGKQHHIGVAIGDFILDLTACDALGLIELPLFQNQWVFTHSTLNAFLKLGATAWEALRLWIQEVLSAQNPMLRDNAELQQKVLIPQGSVQMKMPLHIGDYTDFYASKHHATRVGQIFRGAEAALAENWLHMPIAYHGRASSVFLSGTPIHRPSGLVKVDNKVLFSKSQKLDFELETGLVVGTGNKRAMPIQIKDADGHIFGFCLLNDWSARDIQQFEYQPLGPFLGKNFCTTISPWIVPAAALAPFQVPHEPQVPQVAVYLQKIPDYKYNIEFKVELKTKNMQDWVEICNSNHQDLYWTSAQMLAHHTVNGCPLRTGDILGSGTISGATDANRGCLLEITQDGRVPIHLPNGEERTYLCDGDALRLTALAKGNDFCIGFGDCTSQIEV